MSLNTREYRSNYFYKLNRLMKAEEARVKLVKRAISGEKEEGLSWDIDENDEEGSGNVDSQKKKKDVDKDGERCLKIDVDKNAGSCKASDVLIVSSQFSMPEEEGWDEIEEIRSNNDSKGEDVGSTNKVDTRKRLSVAEEEEDLSWDIDDDEDQSVKA